MTGVDMPTAAKRPESADKARWVLWLSHDMISALRAESERTGEPMAQIVRDATRARVLLTAEQVDAFKAEATRIGVPLPEVLAAALSAGCPTAAALRGQA